MIHIYIESGVKKSKKQTTNEYDFIEKFVREHFPDKEIDTDYVIEGWDGKDRWKEYQPKLQENRDKGDKNIIVFDADSPETDGGFAARQALYDSYKEKYDIDFSLFLWPNNAEDGDFEIMLEKITHPSHQRVLTCFENFENSIEAYNQKAIADQLPKPYHTPNQKNKIHTYISTIIKTSQEEKNFPQGYWAFDNSNYWQLTNKYLTPLKVFLSTHCGW